MAILPPHGPDLPTSSSRPMVAALDNPSHQDTSVSLAVNQPSPPSIPRDQVHRPSPSSTRSSRPATSLPRTVSSSTLSAFVPSPYRPRATNKSLAVTAPSSSSPSSSSSLNPTNAQPRSVVFPSPVRYARPVCGSCASMRRSRSQARRAWRSSSYASRVLWALLLLLLTCKAARWEEREGVLRVGVDLLFVRSLPF
ncbi:hypothetical protein KC357_g55 [Hortaea werneckii]|nr:hypothetical protein KC357_g55 [Hortaea werneckii]